MDFQEALSEFISFAGRIDSKDHRSKFFQWLSENIKDLQNDESEAFSGTINVEVELKGIAAELRKRLPLDATLSSETIYMSLVGPNSDCNATNTIHVDAFLYDDDLLDSLVEDGKLSRSYCKDCGSKNTSPLNFVSHSASIPRLRVIFQEILPDLTGKVVLDIGSRLGPVLYGAYYYSNAARIIGIEINQEFVQLQSQVVQGKGFTDRIEVIHGDICQRADILKAANVIVLNNVFEFFVSPENHVKIWQFLRREINPGTLLVTIPSLEEEFAALNTGIVLGSWVKPLPPCNPGMIDDYEELEVSEVKLYQVL